MAINFETTDSQKLLSSFKDGIRQGHIVTWSCDTDGDFTHTTEQWKNQAWMRPVLYRGQLTMNFIGNSRATKPMREIYAIYHGRFIESMLAHCDRLFTNATATALATTGDKIPAAA
jgi:hypothetical protein